MALVEATLLTRYHDWKVFGTGTWSSARIPGELHQRKALFAFMYATAKLARLPFRRLIWAARHELGEIGGREHYHWLIGARDWQPSLSNMFQMNQLWNNFPGGGFSRNHIFSPELNGIDYICKCLSDSAVAGSVGGDFYETGKFGQMRSSVTLSNSFLRSPQTQAVSTTSD